MKPCQGRGGHRQAMESRQGRGEAIDKRWSPVRDVEGIGRDAVRRSRTESLCKIGFTYTI